MSNYNFERISKTNLKDLVTLHRDTLGQIITIDSLGKKFDTNTGACSYLGYLAYDDSQNPAAYYGVFPVYISLGTSELILTAQSADTMTHPNHQGKGLFTKLALKTYALAKEEGVKIVWGFPNKNSYPGFIKKLNWKDHGPLTRFKLTVKTVPVSKVLKKLNVKWVNSMYYKVCKWILGGTLKEYIKLDEGGHPFVLKDRNFFNYKAYYEERLIIGDIENKVWAKLDGGLLIGDVDSKDTHSFKKLMSEIQSKCLWLGISEIGFICNATNPNYVLFAQHDKVTMEDSLPYCYLSGWDDELAQSLSVCAADFDTF